MILLDNLSITLPIFYKINQVALLQQNQILIHVQNRQDQTKQCILHYTKQGNLLQKYIFSYKIRELYLFSNYEIAGLTDFSIVKINLKTKIREQCILRFHYMDTYNIYPVKQVNRFAKTVVTPHNLLVVFTYYDNLNQQIWRAQGLNFAWRNEIIYIQDAGQFVYQSEVNKQYLILLIINAEKKTERYLQCKKSYLGLEYIRKIYYLNQKEYLVHGKGISTNQNRLLVLNWQKYQKQEDYVNLIYLSKNMIFREISMTQNQIYVLALLNEITTILIFQKDTFIKAEAQLSAEQSEGLNLTRGLFYKTNNNKIIIFEIVELKVLYMQMLKHLGFQSYNQLSYILQALTE